MAGKGVAAEQTTVELLKSCVPLRPGELVQDTT